MERARSGSCTHDADLVGESSGGLGAGLRNGHACSVSAHMSTVEDDDNGTNNTTSELFNAGTFTHAR